MPAHCSRRGNEADTTVRFRPPIRLLTSAATFFSQALSPFACFADHPPSEFVSIGVHSWFRKSSRLLTRAFGETSNDSFCADAQRFSSDAPPVGRGAVSCSKAAFCPELGQLGGCLHAFASPQRPTSRCQRGFCLSKATFPLSFCCASPSPRRADDKFSVQTKKAAQHRHHHWRWYAFGYA